MVLLPRIIPLDEVDDDTIDLEGDTNEGFLDETPPAISPVRRKLLLAKLVTAIPSTGRSLAEAARLADTLIHLLDTLQHEEISLENLDTLVEEDLADHWQETLNFLAILRKEWPALLDEIGEMEPVTKRCRMRRRLAKHWEEIPPAGPVLVAGSTGSIPSTRNLIRVVTSLDQGEIVLPGLDRDIDSDSWEVLDDNETHPQFGIKLLLRELGIKRENVRDWPGTEKDENAIARGKLLSETMRPAETSNQWPLSTSSLDMKAAMKNLVLIKARDSAEEAGAIALLMRETLETKEKTCALVTNDPELVRRVRINLRRWGIEVEDSSGVRLMERPCATLFRLAARVGASAGTPVELLSLLKHRLAACGTTLSACRRNACSVEQYAIRGLRPWEGIDALREKIQAKKEKKNEGITPTVEKWIGTIDKRLRPFRDLLQKRASASEIFNAHRGFVEWVADAGEEELSLYSGQDGGHLKSFLEQFEIVAKDLGKIDGTDYPALFDAAIENEELFHLHPAHPRLRIWTPIEARMQSADRMIAGGLVEDLWPRGHPPDPWLSQNMRKELGLATVERRTGLAAHDFVGVASAHEAFLTHAAKVRGTPTVPARWITRLQTVLKTAGEKPERSDTPAWWRKLFQAPPYKPIKEPPGFAPPLKARPRELSVTQIRTLFQEPYAAYGKHVLGLKPLAPLAGEPSAADFGSAVHRAVEKFTTEHGGPKLPDDALNQLLSHGEKEFKRFRAAPAMHALWWHRYKLIANWFLTQEKSVRQRIDKVRAELLGRLNIDFPGGPFILTARADRIEVEETNQLVIVDYKSGTLPTKKNVNQADDPQLPLSALIASKGGFEPVPAATVAKLTYWHLTGRRDGGGLRDAGKHNVNELIAEAEKRFRETITLYDDGAVAYKAVPTPSRYSDYIDLARIREWTIVGVQDEQGEGE